MDSSINSRSSTALSGRAVIRALIVIHVFLASGASCKPSGFEEDGERTPGPAIPPGGVRDVDDSFRDHYYGDQDPGVLDELAEPAPVVRQLPFAGDFVSNHIPVNPEGHQDKTFVNPLLYPDADPKVNARDGQKMPAAPKYMVDLYHKFSTDRYIHPVTNIVRSFMNINEGM